MFMPHGGWQINDGADKYIAPPNVAVLPANWDLEICTVAQRVVAATKMTPPLLPTW
jgi:hypothetical protein